MPSDPHYWSAKHRRWRDAVLRRDGYLCQECARYGKRTEAVVAHHIVPRDTTPTLQYTVSNGRALCASCHNRMHPEKGGIPPTPYR